MNRATLECIDRFRVPARIVGETETALRASGARRLEVFVLWSGVANGRLFEVRTAHVPRQTSFRLELGLCVRVEGDELHRLNRWLFDAGERLAAQLHAHPTDAYHSATDDAFPIVTALGGLSIVAPNFGREGILGAGTRAYRLGATGWRELDATELRRLIEVVPQPDPGSRGV